MYLPNCTLNFEDLYLSKENEKQFNFFLEGVQCRVPTDSWITLKLTEKGSGYIALLKVNSSTLNFSEKHFSNSIGKLLKSMKDITDNHIKLWHKQRVVA